MTDEEMVAYWSEWFRKNPPPPLTAEQVHVIREAFWDPEDLKALYKTDDSTEVHMAKAQVLALDRAAAWELAATRPERARAWLKNLWDTEDRYLRSRAEARLGPGADE